MNGEKDRWIIWFEFHKQNLIIRTLTSYEYKYGIRILNVSVAMLWSIKVAANNLRNDNN